MDHFVFVALRRIVELAIRRWFLAMSMGKKRKSGEETNATYGLLDSVPCPSGWV
jgi:hypothetical protein